MERGGGDGVRRRVQEGVLRGVQEGGGGGDVGSRGVCNGSRGVEGRGEVEAWASRWSSAPALWWYLRGICVL